MIHTDLIQSIPALLRKQAAERGDKMAYTDGARSVTYRELEIRTANLAGNLVALGIKPGDTVAILLPNSVEWVEVCFSILRAGAICVPISYQSSFPEVEYRILDANCGLIISTDEMSDMLVRLSVTAPSLKAVLMSRGKETENGIRLSDLMQTQPSKRCPDPDDIDRVSFIVYTSGTTGRAKGVLLSVRSMLWVTAACWVPITQLAEDDVVLSPLPLFHSYALNLSVLGILATGCSEYILEKYSTDEILKLLSSGRYTVMPGVPTMFHYLLKGSSAENASFPNLRMCISAGAIMPATLNREFEERFNVPLLDGYGITETSTMVTMNWPSGTRVMGSCGLPIPGLAVRIVDADGMDVETGKEGELIVRGPNLMFGYHNKPAETAAALKNGWYHTGDLAKSDESGFLTITGRLKELIIRGGQNIAPAEIEEIVSIFESVLDCAVVGAPHEHLGEVPVLFVSQKAGYTVQTEALIAHCESQLSAYKVPRAIHIVEEIPRTGSGKILRYQLRQRLQAANARPQ